MLRLLHLLFSELVRFHRLANAWLVRRLTAAAPVADARSLPCLCIGDSLTGGYHNVWPHPELAPLRSAADASEELRRVRFHPYSLRLGALLAADAAEPTEGVAAALRYARCMHFSGWTAEEMLPELRAALRERRWRCVCLLAGSNDIILHGVDAATVLGRIGALHRLVDEAGVPLVALTHLDADASHIGPVPRGEAAARRAALGELARLHVAACRRERRALADTRSALPFGSECFDDSMHPSPLGSDRIAELVHATMVRHGL